MKVVVFSAGKKQKRSKAKSVNPGARFERVLFFLFVFLFVSLIVVQAAMMNPSIRTFFTGDTGLEGSPLQYEEYLYSQGEISVALCNEDLNEDLKLLVNGDEVAAFSQKLINIKVKHGDVISIDGSLASESEVEIVSASTNIISNDIGKRIKVNSNVKQLTRIIIE
ncbi:MAG: hypothetical protein GX383_09150 [Clostridium sp.]|mgnify:CR=1 FL=1|jgi:hypothetical protein|nr:hypothetical protein [Clostridium sp.]